MKPPALVEMKPETYKADELLMFYGFRRDSLRDGTLLTYEHSHGAVPVLVVLDVTANSARLSRSIPGEPFKPWSCVVSPQPLRAALEACWFVAISHGLTPPTIGGTLVTDWKERHTPDTQKDTE